MKKSTNPLMQLLVLAALALLMLVVSTVFSILIGLAGVNIAEKPGLLWIQAITQVLTLGVPVLIVGGLYYKGSLKAFLRLDFGGDKWIEALTGVVVMLLLVPCIEWLTEWNDGWNLGSFGEMLRSLQNQTEGIVEDFMETGTVGGLLANLLVVALVPAVCEELFFRCGVQNLLQRSIRNPHWAVLIAAAVFSLIHVEIFSFMPRFVLGLLLGYMYVYSGSALPNMVAHFTNNAIVVLLYWLSVRGVIDIDPEAPVDFGWLATVCCLLAAAALFVVSFVKRQKTSKQ